MKFQVSRINGLFWIENIFIFVFKVNSFNRYFLNVYSYFCIKLNNCKYLNEQPLLLKVDHIISLDTIKNNKKSSKNILLENDDFVDIMKQSFEFWHKNYIDSPLNYPLVWKKALESNSEIIQKIDAMWKKNTKQIGELQLQQFFEIWSYAIRKSNFEVAKKSICDWEEFWKNATDDELQLYGDILELIGKYWKDMQSKNFE